MLNLDALAKATVASAPFPYLAVSNALDDVSLARISRDFPTITQPGVFPLSDLRYGAAFDTLIKDLQGPAFQALVAEKFDIDLAGRR